MKGIIDRFEEDLVVVEIGNNTQDFDKRLFPADASPGDVVTIEGDKITILKDETAKRRKEVEDLMNELFE
ncbi:Protein of unknown function [Fictibacillus solisalsi]|uniref:Uncharacterized protein n=1 Tax=Fictibacillus solisalsi TaxID=459525 RepID=A0A1H0BJT7_9BACL|nr:DUF3006 domain-containing protein [Fictibacillus solisalsi]SDN45909.1 Protein of unknown function [Fictibacillus solisalsi]